MEYKRSGLICSEVSEYREAIEKLIFQSTESREVLGKWSEYVGLRTQLWETTDNIL